MTRSASPLLLLLAAVLSGVSVQGSDNSCTGVQDRGPWDFLMLVLSWPPTACETLSTECSNHRVKNRFVVHGLWPMYKDGSWPVFCKSTPFDYSEVKGLRQDLDKYWTDLSGQDLVDFDRTQTGGREHLWKEQWETHGVCLSKHQHNFFSQAVSLRKSFPLESYMWSKGIYPTNNRVFKAQDMFDAFSFGLGSVKPVLICSPPRTSAQDTTECSLHEVRVCLNRERVPIDCPKSVKKCAAKEGVTCDNRMVRVPMYDESGSIDKMNQPPLPPSGSAIFLLYLFLFIFFYVFGGCALNIRANQTQLGLASCPNRKFWEELPGLVKDGCVFSQDKVKQLVWYLRDLSRGAKRDEEPRNIYT
eukprot:CAMPEP_0175826630 /NCGR_PEP_ID=MMETSP0107_2-20121207/11865_1 /TAXON_ID=195067 ORGANISM="Goniomonas pacifica, Strain CCMP1869" /NCGR_SAMPLE_ID=MMETSP0107_2 /ASSEMBLY_ACC=CAM_ASM_000203 /LENGTH=358 /DNA_ID=CAMNT_0017139277 /DNA_START=10 /DNA_END=1086 /DNA_ORIENTATION=+